MRPVLLTLRVMLMSSPVIAVITSLVPSAQFVHRILSAHRQTSRVAADITSPAPIVLSALPMRFALLLTSHVPVDISKA